MSRPIKFILLGALVCLCQPPARAQIGGTGWTPMTVNFKIQSPTNAPQSSRYFFTNNIFHCLVFSNDGAFSIGNTTKPRTEQRFNPDYTGGEIQYQATMMAPSNENSYCVFQIHTGDAQSPTYGSTTFMAFWFTNSGGSVHDYSGTTLATNLGDRWFQLNVDHNLATGTIRVWINQNLVWTQPDNGAGDFYFKDGVYEQDHGPTYEMDTYITNTIKEWVSSGTNPPAAPTGLAAAPATAQIALSWNSSVGATNYILKRSATNGGPYTPVLTLSGTSDTDSNLVSGTIYYYVVSAVDQFGESSNSTPVSASLVSAGFELAVTPAAVVMAAGGGTNYTVTLTTNSGFGGTTYFGIAGLPAGATAGISPPTLTKAGTTTLTVQTVTNTPGGNYVLTILATNGAVVVATNVALTLAGLSASPGTLQWIGGQDANWFTVPNWTNLTAGGYGPPGISNNVIFTNAGAASIQGQVNNAVNSAVSILSLQYSQTNNYHTTQIATGQTLTIASNLTAGTGTDLGPAGTLWAAIAGGGMLCITNTNCVVSVRQGTATGSGPWLQRATLDLSGLDTFSAKLGRVLVAGDGNSAAFNSREVGTLYLAKTNLIIAAGAAPAIDVAENASSGAGSTGDPRQLSSYLYLGLTNGIFADSMAIGRSKCAGIMVFNPALTNGNTPGVYLRGYSSNQMGTFSVGDDSALGGSNQREAGTVVFDGGAVDLLAGSIFVGRSMNGSNSGTGVSATGVLSFDDGTIVADVLEIGYQTYAGDTGPGPVGTVNVNGDGTLRTSQTLELAHGTSNVPLEQGTLNLNGGTVQATNINGGGGISTINLNSGFIDLQFTNRVAGQIRNVSTLNIGANGVGDPALLANAAGISVSNVITIAGNGTLAGNPLINSPGLMVAGTLAPGIDGIGAITNNGATTFGAGGGFEVEIQDAEGAPGTGWDFLAANGELNVQATNGNPFTIQVESFNPDGSGLAANFNPQSNYAWTIATASGGISNFSAARFAVDASGFENGLAGGSFSVQSQGDSLVLVFCAQPPPIFAGVTFAGTNLVLRGGGGTATTSFFVLGATNLALPLSQWPVIGSNVFDASGNFLFTSPPDSTISGEFYRLKVQ